MKVDETDNEHFDILWSDTAVPPEKLQKLKPYQWVNHFPGMHALARKNNLGKNLYKMNKVYPDEYNFYPSTWMLPTDASDLRLYI